MEEIKEEKKVLDIEDKRPGTETKPGMRQIIIETDGNNIKLIKAEVSGSIELRAIFQNLIAYINNQK